MKNYIILAATALLCVSCFSVNTNFKGGKNTVKGEGPVITKTLDFKDFDAIEVNGSADIVFTQADTWEVTVRTQENIFDVLDFKVNAGTLVLEAKDRQNIRAEEYEVTIKAPQLKEIEMNGAGDINIPGGLRSEGDFQVEINGAGDVEMTRIVCKELKITANGTCDVDAHGIDVESVKVQINGAGDVELSGKAGSADLEVNGAGDINATGLQVAGEVKRHAAGIAKIKI